MPEGGQSVGILAFLLLLFLAIYIIQINPFLGLVVLFSGILIFAISMDPGSAKVMFKLFTPIILALLLIGFLGQYIGGLSREYAIIFVIFLFLLTIGLMAIFGGVDASSGLVIAPMIILPTLLALLADPSGYLAILVASVVMFGWMFFVYLLIRKPLPEYDIGFSKRVGTALTDLNPRGKIKVGAEIWKAISPNVKIKKGEEVYILDVKNLELIVTLAVRCPVCDEVFPIINIPDECPRCRTSLFDIKVKADDILSNRIT